MSRKHLAQNQPSPSRRAPGRTRSHQRLIASADRRAADTVDPIDGREQREPVEPGGTARDMCTLEEFLVIASHELKTPLATMRLITHSLRREARRLGSAEGRRFRDKLLGLERQVDRLDGLIEQLLDSSRIEAGRFGLERTRLDLCRLVCNAVERFVHSGRVSQGTIRLRTPAPIYGDWDAIRLDQVVTNLVANALRYGEGRPVDVIVGRRGEQATLLVKDRGCGISPENHERIFERFERVDAKPGRAGFGLGLWIVREIVEAHEGRILLSSALGLGSTFTVYLPLPDGH